jgi:hypothetical protein
MFVVSRKHNPVTERVDISYQAYYFEKRVCRTLPGYCIFKLIYKV